jgi:hypothetical protein
LQTYLSGEILRGENNQVCGVKTLQGFVRIENTSTTVVSFAI